MSQIIFLVKITVTGLVTGSDILRHIEILKSKKIELGEYILIPNIMLKNDEKIFLDNMRLKDLKKQIGIDIKIADSSAIGFIDGVLDNK